VFVVGEEVDVAAAAAAGFLLPATRLMGAWALL
jgi:hypothetical protein